LGATQLEYPASVA